MLYKRMMYLVATVPLIFLIGFIAVPDFFVLQSYPSAVGFSFEIGITHLYIMSGMFFIVVCIAFQSINVEKMDNQKSILLRFAIGSPAMCAVVLSVLIIGGILNGITPMISTGIVAVLSLWSFSKLHYHCSELSEDFASRPTLRF